MLSEWSSICPISVFTGCERTWAIGSPVLPVPTTTLGAASSCSASTKAAPASSTGVALRLLAGQDGSNRPASTMSEFTRVWSPSARARSPQLAFQLSDGFQRVASRMTLVIGGLSGFCSHAAFACAARSRIDGAPAYTDFDPARSVGSPPPTSTMLPGSTPWYTLVVSRASGPSTASAAAAVMTFSTLAGAAGLVADLVNSTVPVPVLITAPSNRCSLGSLARPATEQVRRAVAAAGVAGTGRGGSGVGVGLGVASSTTTGAAAAGGGAGLSAATRVPANTDPVPSSRNTAANAVTIQARGCRANAAVSRPESGSAARASCGSSYWLIRYRITSPGCRLASSLPG